MVMHRKYPIPLYLIAGLFMILNLAGCSLLQDDQAASSTPEVQPEFAPVISVTGVVVPEQWANLSMPSAGILSEILVNTGDTVEAGQVLLRLAGGDPDNPSPEISAALRAAELEVASAQRSLEDLSSAAEAALIQADQLVGSASNQVREIELQIEALDIPDEQAMLTPLEAFDQARASYQDALEAFAPYEDEPRSNQTRQDRLEELNQAREDYGIAVARLQLSMALSAAEANLENARRDAEAYANGPLLEDLALAQARLAAAQASLEAAQSAFESLTLVAPFSGTVTAIHVRVGEWVSPGLPALVLADLTGLQIETTDLNEIDMAQVQTGDTVTVYFDALPEVTATGTVVYISPQASPGAGVNYTAVIRLDQLADGLRWGMSAFVDISLER
jgi:multidrug resistance efflux pump